MADSVMPTSSQQENIHEHLTEDSIRHVALRFLKTYYKYRPRLGETTVGKNLTTASGIVVDGYLSFQKEDELPFLATLEASSYSKRGEVKYTTQNLILTWDALAVGSLCGLLLFSYGYAYNHFTVEQLGLFGSLSILLGTILLVFALFRLVSRGFSRYRYIYAVEQFKRYFADEQWIAIGEDVFDNPEDKRMKELKNQCVTNGFGLIVIDKNFEGHLLITPARKEVVKGRKQVFKVLSDNKLTQVLRKTPLTKVWRKMKNTFSRIVKKTPVKTDNLFRFRRKFWRQAVVVFICFGLTGNILYRELKDADIIHVDEKIYQDEMSELIQKTKPEPQAYLLDSAEAAKTRELKSQESLVDFQDLETIDYQERQLPAGEVAKTEEVAVWHDKQFIYYDCTRFFNFKGQKFVVADGVFPNLQEAEARIRQLSQANISSNAFWLGCFDKARGYVVYYDQIYNKRTTAGRAAESFADVFGRSRVKKGDLKVMVLER